MTANSPTTTQQASSYFEAQIRKRLAYWGNHEAVKTIDIQTLDRRRESVLNVISFGLELQDAWPLVRDLMLAFTRFMERRGHWQIWNDLLHRAIAVANHVGDTDGAVTISALLARLYLRQGPPEKTIFHHRQVIALARQAGNHYEEARGLTNLGYFYIDAGYWWRSEVLCCAAMEVIDQIEGEDGDYLRAVTENHFGILYQRKNQWLIAEQHYTQACNIWENMEDHRGNLLFGYMNLGVLFIKKSEPNTAIEWHQKALEQVAQNGDNTHQAVVTMNLAVAYQEKEDFDEAIEFYKEAENLLRQNADILNLTRVFGNLGILYRQQQRWEQALEYMQAASEGYKSLNNWEGQLECLFDFLDYAIDIEDDEMVLFYMSQAEAMIDKHSQGTHRAKLMERLASYRQPGKLVGENADRQN